MTRGGGKAFVYTGPFVTGSGGTVTTFIDLTTWGTFTRASVATALDGAATDGSSEFMRVYQSDVRRTEDRGDGNGRMLLLEGARTNLIYNAENIASSSGAWSGIGGATTSINYANTPYGPKTANRLQSLSGVSYIYNSPTVSSGTDYAISVWQRSSAGSAPEQILIYDSAAVVTQRSMTTTWYRDIMLRNAAATSLGMYLADGRDLSAWGGLTPAAARDVVAWGAQIEAGAFASSFISATTTTATRSQDILSGSTATVPAAMLNGALSFYVAPIFSSSEGVTHAADQCIFSFAEDDSERIFFVVSGGSIYIRVTSGGATKVTSNALTFSAHQKMSVTVNGSAGSITVGGATTGNGTVTGTGWTRTTGATTYVGSRQGGTQPLFARLGPLSRNPSSAKIVLFQMGQSNMNRNGIRTSILREVQKYYPNAKSVEYAVDGTTLYADWNKSGGAVYAAAVAAWNAAYTSDPNLAGYTPIIVWGQGESDASDATWTAAYSANLSAFFTNLESDIPFLAGCKKIIHRLLPTNAIDTSPGQTRNATIRTAQSDYYAAHPTLVGLTETSDLTTTDGIHFDAASSNTIAVRDAALIHGWIG